MIFGAFSFQEPRPLSPGFVLSFPNLQSVVETETSGHVLFAIAPVSSGESLFPFPRDTVSHRGQVLFPFGKVSYHFFGDYVSFLPYWIKSGLIRAPSLLICIHLKPSVHD
jgi:hypothetical protein